MKTLKVKVEPYTYREKQYFIVLYKERKFFSPWKNIKDLLFKTKNEAIMFAEKIKNDPNELLKHLQNQQLKYTKLKKEYDDGETKLSKTIYYVK